MIEYNKSSSGKEEIFEQNRSVPVQNDGKYSLTQLWEVIVRKESLPGEAFILPI